MRESRHALFAHIANGRLYGGNAFPPIARLLQFELAANCISIDSIEDDGGAGRGALEYFSPKPQR